MFAPQDGMPAATARTELGGLRCEGEWVVGDLSRVDAVDG